MNFEARLEKYEFILNDTDDIIADYIKRNKSIIHTISIKKISSETFVAPNAIMRFSKKIKYSGFSDMKFSILGENKDKVINRLERSNCISKTIMKSDEVIDELVLKQLSQKLSEANNCIVLGLGDNLFFCEMIVKYLRIVHIKSEFYHHLHEMLYSVRGCSENDLIMVISVSGEKERLINLAKIAKERKAIVISLTHFSDNQLVRIADINLFFWAELEILNGYDVTDRSGLMMLLRRIIEQVWSLKNDR